MQDSVLPQGVGLRKPHISLSPFLLPSYFSLLSSLSFLLSSLSLLLTHYSPKKTTHRVFTWCVDFALPKALGLDWDTQGHNHAEEGHAGAL